MADCVVCKKKAEITSIQGQLCKKCFVRAIEKRVRKFLRTKKIIKPHDKVICADCVTEHLLKSILESIPITIKFAKKFSEEDENAVILEKRTLDDEISDYLKNVFYGKLIAKPQKTHSILITLTDREIKMFAEYYGLKFSPNKKESEIKKILDKMTDKYPETRYALRKSMNTISDLK